MITIKDITGREIELRKERWRHITAEHPRINLEMIKSTLKSPLKITKSKYDPEKVTWYYRYIKDKRRYVFVAVKYLNSHGFIITSYFMRKIR